jgi:hypothetical protein
MEKVISVFVRDDAVNLLLVEERKSQPAGLLLV